MAAADIGDRRPALQLRHDIPERGQPGRHEVALIGGAEEAPDGAEQAGRLPSPADALAAAERALHQRLVVHQRGRHVEAALHEERPLGVGEEHRLLRRQGEASAAGIVGQIAGGRLMREPFPGIAFGHARLRCQLGRGHGSPGLERLVEAQPVTETDECHAAGTAEIAEHLAYHLVKLRLVHAACSSHASMSRSRHRASASRDRKPGRAWHVATMAIRRPVREPGKSSRRTVHPSGPPRQVNFETEPMLRRHPSPAFLRRGLDPGCLSPRLAAHFRWNAT